MERIVPANLEGDELWRRNGEYVDAGSYDAATTRIAALEAALREIARPTYGTEINDTDAERADVYWSHIVRFQDIARKALND